ncbi:hypothetical protein Nepgr_019406 [Nepenthes gracilis]|uniref:Uncharacterized protein n=1 Tax=Nepenthes gracilis TaxID=150966 RepID=A0AAD3XV73_NEPGR|nr:hypothetical protein Nepgr_019406 [Nepenthes gracilis]
MSIRPITDEDCLAVLEKLSCLEEAVCSPALGTTPGTFWEPEQLGYGGDPSPCTSIGKLRRNIVETRKQLDANRARSAIPSPHLADNGFQSRFKDLRLIG